MAQPPTTCLAWFGRRMSALHGENTTAPVRERWTESDLPYLSSRVVSIIQSADAKVDSVHSVFLGSPSLALRCSTGAMPAKGRGMADQAAAQENRGKAGCRSQPTDAFRLTPAVFSNHFGPARTA